MKRGLLRLPTVLALTAVLALPAHAQFAKPEEAVEYRQAAFTLMANHMKRIKSQLDYGKPSMEVIRSSAALVETLKTLPFEAFVPGSGDVGDTAAKPEIWSENERFRKLAGDMQEQVRRLNDAARAGDISAIRGAFGDTGKACKNCHEDFRRKR